MIYREAAIATFRREHRARLPNNVARVMALTTKQDIVMRVPITTTRVGPDRLFGDEIFFLMRVSRGRYVIAGVAEKIPY